jgi:hypothetical protein
MGNSDPIIREAGGSPSTELQQCFPDCCARPPGVVMVAPQSIPRKAARTQSEGATRRRERETRDPKGGIKAGVFGLRPSRSGCYSSSRKVTSTLTL